MLFTKQVDVSLLSKLNDSVELYLENTRDEIQGLKLCLIITIPVKLKQDRGRVN